MLSRSFWVGQICCQHSAGALLMHSLRAGTAPSSRAVTQQYVVAFSSVALCTWRRQLQNGPRCDNNLLSEPGI